MTKTLIIAEKPSVAQDISRALGGFERHDGYFENDQYVLSSSVGHLLTLVNPDDVVRGKWSFTHLPAIPKKEFDIQPIDKKATERLKLLLKLLKRKDIDGVINACDAGREGELIFRYIVQYAKVNKPIQRLWLQSMTKQAIIDAFNNLRDDESMKPLEAAARSRAEADWLVGINGTRAMTAFNSKDGGFFKTPIGRVQTPTLAIVFKREEAIRAFKPRDYWEVHASFVAAGGIYEGRWFDPNFKKDPNDPELKDNRLWSQVAAQSIVIACRGKSGTVQEESKPLMQNSPALFDLTSLQREANARFGFTAKTTLALAQALYERHKVITYPRTDSRYLPEDYLPTVNSTLGEISRSESNQNRLHKAFAARILEQHWVKPNKRIFDNKKVSDHFAIIPTPQVPKELSEAESKIYDLITKRFMAVFFPPAEYRVTTRITIVSAYHFKTEGKILVKPGWLEIYGRESQAGDDANLAVVEPNEHVKTDEVRLEALVTKPPPHYTEATLLSAMEGAGKLIDNDELREAMSERGLGTPATRATIIEGLINDQYLRREARDLIPTTKTRQLMTLLNGLNVKELTSPELTGEWEHKLKQMEQGKLDRKAFMQEVAQSTQVIVKRAKEYEHDTIPGDYVTLQTPCPACGGVVKENYRRFACTSCDFSITKNPGGRNFETEEAESLLQNRTLGPLSGFISKLGRPFSAILRLTDENKLEFDFGQSDEDEAEEIDFSALQSLAKCPKCDGQVYDVGMNYICNHAANKDKTCDFKSGKVILQQEISNEQMRKLLTDGKTDLLDNFVSNRTNRKFKAFLVLDNKGKVSFEFEPRPAKKAAAKKATKSAAKSTTTTATKAAPKTAAKKTATKKTATKKTAVKKAS